MSITLSTGIPAWFIDQFSETLYHVCQQKPSKLQKAVVVDNDIIGEDKSYDMMGEFSLVDKTGRNPQTPTLDPTTQRRWVKPEPAHNAVVYDKDDDLSMLLNPVGDFVTAFRYAVNRKKDSVIYSAFDATVQAGRKYGDSTVSWPSSTKFASSGRIIAHDTAEGNASGASCGLTKEKIELALQYFGDNDVDEDIPLFGLIAPAQATDLRGQQEFISADYNTDKPLARGRMIGQWMGINWIQYTGVTLGSSNDVDADTNVYPVWVWAQDGMKLGVKDDLTVTINVRPDLSNGQQVYVHINVGAMRMDEDKVCKIECI